MKRLITSHAVPGPTIASRPHGRPILLSDSATIESSGQATFTSESFTNTLDTPIEIHSLRVYCEAPQNRDGASKIGLAGLISLRLACDGVPLTRGFVPAYMLAPSDSREPVSTNGGDYEHPAVTWRFARPMPLMPRKTITIEAKHLGVTNESITVRVSFAGRVVPTVPGRYVPFAAAWTTRSFGPSEDAFEVSPPAVIANDTGREMHVDRIIGRFVAFNPTLIPGGASRQQYYDFGDDSLQSVQAAEVRLSLSKNRVILRDFTQWRAVFGQNCAVETDFDLASGDYLIAGVHHLPSTIAAALTYFQGRALVSIVGGREA